LRETYKNLASGRGLPREERPLSRGNVQNMTRAHRNVNIGAVILPFVAFLAAIPLLWNQLVGWTDLAIFAGIYLATALGVTVGFHRMLTHRSFETYRPVKYALAILGSMAVQGDVIAWVSDHRKHHAYADEEGDPHSPHVGHGEGWRAALRGLYHAHVGWLFVHHSGAEAKRFAPDLLEDRGMRAISRNFLPLVGVSLLLPFGLGFLVTGQLAGALTALLWGGLVRIFLVHHVTWSINSICHFFGRRRFETDDESTNVLWLALPSLGESWHHNHHAFPRSAIHGLRWWEIDVTGLVIRAMQRLGLAWNVVRITPERQSAKLAT
jgi:stearoyl-CoA desaturase (delta-9 desaturase)